MNYDAVKGLGALGVPVTVKKWGDSMAVLIPSHFAKSRKIGVGTVVDIEPIRTVRPSCGEFKLSQLMVGFK